MNKNYENKDYEIQNCIVGSAWNYMFPYIFTKPDELGMGE
jgi:hypothetical protein